MHRCFVTSSRIQGDLIELAPGDAHHVANVLRLTVGAPITVLDGQGEVFETTAVQVEKRRVMVKIQSRHQALRPTWSVHLALAMLKNKALDHVLAKSVEVGVSGITLLNTDHAVSKIDQSEVSRKTEGWVATLVEAAKQCGNPWLPSLEGPLSIADWLATKPHPNLLMVAALRPGAAHLKSIVSRFVETHGRAPKSAVVAIGPEGDFSAAELDGLEAAGFQPLTLGPTVLRAETAAVVAAAVLMHELSA